MRVGLIFIHKGAKWQRITTTISHFNLNISAGGSIPYVPTNQLLWTMKYIRNFIIHLLGGVTLEESMESDNNSFDIAVYSTLEKLKLFAVRKDDKGELYHHICSELKKLIWYVTHSYPSRMSELHIVLPHQEQLPWTEFWIFRRQHLSVPSLLSAVHRSRCCLRTEEPP